MDNENKIIYSGSIDMGNIDPNKDINKLVLEMLEKENITIPEDHEALIIFNGASDDDGISESISTSFNVYSVNKNADKEKIIKGLNELKQYDEQMNHINNGIIELEGMKELEEKLKLVIEKSNKEAMASETLRYLLDEVNQLILNAKKLLKQYAKDYEEIYEKMKEIITETDQYLNNNQLLSDEEIEQIMTNSSYQKYQKNRESIEIKNKIEMLKKYISKLNRKVNELKHDINMSESLELSISEYRELSKTLRRKKILSKILEEKGLSSILDKKNSEKTIEEKKQFLAVKKEIMEEVSARLSNNKKSVLDVIVSLYHMEDQMEISKRAKMLRIRQKDFNKLEKNTEKLIKGVRQNKEEKKENDNPAPIPKDLLVPENETNTPKVFNRYIDLDDNEAVYVSRELLDYLDIATTANALFIQGEEYYRLTPFLENFISYHEKNREDFQETEQKVHLKEYETNSVDTRFSSVKIDSIKKGESSVVSPETVANVVGEEIEEDDYVEEDEVVEGENIVSPETVASIVQGIPDNTEGLTEEETSTIEMDSEEEIPTEEISHEEEDSSSRMDSREETPVVEMYPEVELTPVEMNSREETPVVEMYPEEELTPVEMNSGEETSTIEMDFEEEIPAEEVSHEEDSSSRMDSREETPVVEMYPEVELTPVEMNSGEETPTEEDSATEYDDEFDDEDYVEEFDDDDYVDTGEVADEGITDLPPVEREEEPHVGIGHFPHVETIIYKLTKDLDIYPKDCKRYTASNIRPTKVFIKELRSGNYLYNIVHVLPSVGKATVSFFKKLSSKLLLSNRAKKNVKELKRRVYNELTEEELEVLFLEYRGSQLKMDMNLQINPILLTRLKEYGLDKINEINDRIKAKYENLFTTVGEIKALDEKIESTEVSETDKRKYEREREELFEKAASDVIYIHDSRIIGNKYMSGGVHGLEEDFKAIDSKQNYIGRRFAKVGKFDNDLQETLATLGQKLNDAIDDLDHKKIVESFLALESCYFHNTKIRPSLLGKKSVGKKYYTSLVEEFDYRDDPFMRDLFMTVALASATLGAVNAVQTHTGNGISRSEIERINQQNDNAVGYAVQVGKEINNQKATLINGMKAQAYKDTVTISHMSGTDVANSFYQKVQSDIDSIITGYANKSLTDLEVLAQMRNVVKGTQISFQKVAEEYLKELPSSSYNIPAIQNSLEYLTTHPDEIMQMNEAVFDLGNYAGGLTTLSATHFDAFTSLPSDLQTTLLSCASSCALALNISSNMESKYLKKNKKDKSIEEMLEKYINEEYDAPTETTGRRR